MAGIIENGVVKVRFVTPMSVVSNQPVFVTDSLNLKRQVVSQKVQRWEITTNLEPSNNSADFLLHSVTNGYDQVFEIQTPQVYKKTSVINTATSITVNNSFNAGLNEIFVSSNGNLEKGEFIKFSNHDKIYLLLNNITSSPNTALKIFPALTEDVILGNLVLSGKQSIMKVRYDLNTTLGISYIDGVLSDPGTVTFIEAL
jgi:hypothetical protein